MADLFEHRALEEWRAARRAAAAAPHGEVRRRARLLRDAMTARLRAEMKQETKQ